MGEKEIKSKVQKKMERCGWEFLGNENIEWDSVPKRGPDGLDSYMQVLRHKPRTDMEILEQYASRPSFKAVMVTDAYDANGKPIGDYMRAVYVKRGK